MLRKTWKCSCFYSNNIFSKQYKLHIVFKNKHQVFKEYGKILQRSGCDSDEKNCRLLEEVSAEVTRRKNLISEYEQIKEQIIKQYSQLFSEIYTLKENFFDSRFNDFVSHCLHTDDELNINEYPNVNRHSVISNMWTIPIFTRDFCRTFVKEIKHFQMSNLPHMQPNTMNKYGVMLDQIGFSDFLDSFIMDKLIPITSLLYKDYGGDSIDSYKAFIVAYKTGEDVDLSYHYDNAEVSLNISLNDDFTGGDLYFGGMRHELLWDTECSLVKHTVQSAIFHCGQQMHGAIPILSGERFNMIIWLRSSSVRNKLCPMCDKPPSIVDLSCNGDGFTDDSMVNVCGLI